MAIKVPNFRSANSMSFNVKVRCNIFLAIRKAGRETLINFTDTVVRSLDAT